jgi:quercetin dioxygenase-like cupin family protein
MHVVKFNGGKRYKLYGNDYSLMLPRTMTDRIESEFVKVRKGSKTPRHAHKDLEQVYYILKGKALLEIGQEEKMVGKGMMAYIPRDAVHRITAVESLEYIYISCWFKKVAPPRTVAELKAYEKKLVEGDRNE